MQFYLMIFNRGKLSTMDVCDRPNNINLLFFEYNDAYDHDKADDIVYAKDKVNSMNVLINSGRVQ